MSTAEIQLDLAAAILVVTPFCPPGDPGIPPKPLRINKVVDTVS